MFPCERNASSGLEAEPTSAKPRITSFTNNFALAAAAFALVCSFGFPGVEKSGLAWEVGASSLWVLIGHYSGDIHQHLSSAHRLSA